MPEKLLLFLDDSGSRNPDHQPDVRVDCLDWFALGGILVLESDVREAVDRHKAFTDSWGLDYPLHSTKIRGRRKQFSWLGQDAGRAARFHAELAEMLLEIPVVGIACVIDRPGYNGRYKEQYGEDRWLMCKTAYSILIERAAKHARRSDCRLEVFYEGAGQQEDRNIGEYHKALKTIGMPFDEGRSEGYGSLTADDFGDLVLGDAQRQTKANALIQIADLYLYPMVKGGYAPTYQPYVDLTDAHKLADNIVDESEVASLGVKYSCFDIQKGERPDR
ncbi:DUF3800 domain-containing protein [Sphingomonas sp.]|uniref:DUF3800 domain-containing protein n=1 Tax=Sphingomonas sp. TaxID=28214 RepID=UPI00286C1472|nr:DUF3800 domain-containing protein [Sphingomonas sp.]